MSNHLIHLGTDDLLPLCDTPRNHPTPCWCGDHHLVFPRQAEAVTCPFCAMRAVAKANGR